MEEIIDTLKCFTDLDDIIEYISMENADILSVIKVAKQKEENKPLISLLVKANKKIRESEAGESPVSANQSPLLAGQSPVQLNQSPAQIPQSPVHVPVSPNEFIQSPKCQNISDSVSYNPDVHEIVRREAWNSEYYFQDFEKELRRHGCFFASEKEADEFILPRLLKIVRLINYGGRKFVIIKISKHGSPVLEDYTKFQSNYSMKNRCIYNVAVMRETKVGTMMVHEQKWYFDHLNTNEMLTYYHFDWVPYNPWEKDPTWGTDNFNLFTGFQAKPIPEDQININLFKPILDHIGVVWANSDQEVFNYIISWLSHLVKFPRKWLPMITLVGEEGTGKTSVIEFLFNWIFGKHHCIQVSSLDDVIRKFNAHLDHKGLVYIAELQATNTSENTLHKKMDALKPYITDSSLNIEKKGVDVSINRTNYTHYLGSSNNDFCLRLNKSNRRHEIFRTNPCFIGNTSYFDKLYDHFNQEAGNHFYSWLYYLPQDQLLNPYRLIKTDTMQHMINLSLSDSATFIQQLRSSEAKISVNEKDLCIEEYKPNGVLDENHLIIIKDALFGSFKSWCKITGCNKNTQSKFFYSEIKDLLKEYRKFDGPRYYIIPKEWVVFIKQNSDSILTYLENKLDDSSKLIF